MYARVVRFTDIDPGPSRGPGGRGSAARVPAKSLRVVVDESQSTAAVIFFFDTEEDMRKADDALNAMDVSDTPGTRASVDQGEVGMDWEASW